MPSPWRALSPFVLLPLLVDAQVSLDCGHIRVKDQSFNFAKLGGPKTVHSQEWDPPSVHNTTFTIDICQVLKKPKGSKAEDECESGTRVCAKKYTYHGGDSLLDQVIPIAGEYSVSNGRHLEPKYTRLKGSVSHSDSEKEGLIMELHGGQYKEVNQKAIIEFVCDNDWSGNEGFTDSKSIFPDALFTSVQRRADSTDDDNEPELPDLDKGKALQFVSYKPEEGISVLRMRWKTKHACEGAADKPDSDDEKDSSRSWGFFTWFLIIAFLLVATYIIFGSWLNYNRYGARGWDLVPHGDSIRDIPYLVKDWTVGLIDRLRGDSRGGYSAV